MSKFIFISDIPTVTVSLPNYNTNIGATVTLGCSVIATPAANSVYWKRIGANGQTIDIDTNSNRYDGASITNPSLVIYNPDLSDEGNYVCYASNAIGTGNSQQTFLDVTGSMCLLEISFVNCYCYHFNFCKNLVKLLRQFFWQNLQNFAAHKYSIQTLTSRFILDPQSLHHYNF